MVTEGEGPGGEGWTGVWEWQMPLEYEMSGQWDLLYSTGRSIQGSVRAHMGMDMCLCSAESLGCMAEIGTM